MKIKFLLLIVVLILICSSILTYIFYDNILGLFSGLENVVVYNTETKSNNTVDVKRKEPPLDDSSNGHWHGDEWHDESHTTGVIEKSNIADINIDDDEINIGPLLKEGELRRPAETRHGMIVEGYIDYHLRMYPECDELELILKDAENHASWVVSNENFMKDFQIISEESDKLDKDYNMILYGNEEPENHENGDVNLSYLINKIKSMNDDDKLELVSKIEELGIKQDKISENFNTIFNKSISLKSVTHTH